MTLRYFHFLDKIMENSMKKPTKENEFKISVTPKNLKIIYSKVQQFKLNGTDRSSIILSFKIEIMLQ